MTGRPSPSSAAKAAGRLKGVLKPGQISLGKSRLFAYGNDWLKRYKGEAGLVLFPESAEDAVKIVKWAAETGSPLVPSGGRTGLSGGATALNGEAAVSFDRMNRISGFCPEERTVRAEAGVPTARLQEYARERGLCFPVSFASEGSSQIGGNIATNAGGVHVIRYGSMRSHVLGLEAVTGAGHVLRLGRGLVKDASGYDLKHLLIGSEGTLALITKAVLKLSAAPQNPSVFLLSVKKKADLMPLFAAFCRKTRPLAFEVFPDQALKYSFLSHKEGGEPQKKSPADGGKRRGQPPDSGAFPLSERAPFYILIELEEGDQDSALAVFEKALEEGRVQDGVLSQSSSQAEELWGLRENISESLAPFQPYKNDISVRVSRMPDFLEKMEELFESRRPYFEWLWFGHLGDGNLHINILKPDGWDPEDFAGHCESASEALFALARDFEGSVSAEHGVGLLKKPYLKYSRSPQEIEIMKSLKKAFDPHNILNPGKIFDL